MAAIPTIETSRLTLSGPMSTDFPDCYAMWSDPDTVRHVGGVPLTSEDVWGRILRYVGHWTLLGFGAWIARDKAGAFVGEIGFFRLSPRYDATARRAGGRLGARWQRAWERLRDRSGARSARVGRSVLRPASI